MSWKDWILVAIFLLLLIGGPLMIWTWASSNWIGSRRDLTITVQEKWIKSKPGDETQIYMVADTNGNVYQLTDDWFNWRFDSSDRYAKLMPGHNYTVSVFGWRNHYQSWYPNMVFIDEIN